MRKRKLTTLAFTILLTSSSAYAQSETKSVPQPVANFAWRAPSQPLTAPPVLATPIISFDQPEPQNQLRARSLDVEQSSVQHFGSQTHNASPNLRRVAFRQDEVESEVAKISATKENAQAIPATPEYESELPAAQPLLGVLDAGDSVEPNYCDRDCRPNLCDLGCERKLFPRSGNGLEIGGWTQLGYHNRNNVLFNDRKAEANLHQQWLYFDKQAGVTSNWGYRADLLYGIDAQNTQAYGNATLGAPSGWDNGWDNGAYGWALPQLYLQYDNDLWDVKIGKFFSPFGYEVVAAPQNFFYSHSYTMNFTEPFTMTGVMGQRQMTDSISSIFGATVGWDTGFERAAGGFNLITGTRFQPNEYVDLALTTSLGDTGYRDSGTMTSAVAQMKLTDTIDYVIQGDVLNLRKNNEFGIVQYLFREITPCLKLGTRLEWWKSDQRFNNTKSTYEFTMGANYRAHANLTLRPELRFDWGAAAIDPGTPIIGVDAVLTY